MGCWLRKPGVVASLVIVVLASSLWPRIFSPPFSRVSRVREANPPELETNVATWLLRHSVPAADKQKANPLGKDVADITAGRDLFREKCESATRTTVEGKPRSGLAPIRDRPFCEPW